MKAGPNRQAEVHDILVLETDRLRGAVLARSVSHVFPTARVFCEYEASAAARVLAEQPIGLFIVALRGFDLDILTLLGVWAQHADERTRLLLMSPEVDSPVLRAVHLLPIKGVIDCSTTDLREFEFACRTVAAGAPYWCPALATANGAPAPNTPIPFPVARGRQFPPSTGRFRRRG